MKTYTVSIDLDHMGQIEGLTVNAKNKTEARRKTREFMAKNHDLRGKQILWIDEA